MADETAAGWTAPTPRARKDTGLGKRADKACYLNALTTAVKHPDVSATRKGPRGPGPGGP